MRRFFFRSIWKFSQGLIPIAMILFFFILPYADVSAARKFVLVIDAGHGGRDVGAEGTYAFEKDINLNVALEVGRLLNRNRKDIKVIYTRKSDIYLTLEERAQIANNNEADLFVSIHANSSEFTKIARGTETYFAGKEMCGLASRVTEKENSSVGKSEKNKKDQYRVNAILESARMKNATRSEYMARLVQEEYTIKDKRVNRGVQQGDLFVLMNTMMPAVLTEIGFISTLDEEGYITSDKGVRQISSSIYRAILAYKKGIDEAVHEKELVALRSGKNAVRTPNVALNVEEEAETVVELADNSTLATTAPTKEAPTTKEVPVFSLQLLTSREILKDNDYRLKGVAPVTFRKKGELYRCLYLSTTDYNEILAARKDLKDKFGDAFIVSYQGEEEIPTAEAIREFRERAAKKTEKAKNGKEGRK